MKKTIKRYIDCITEYFYQLNFLDSDHLVKIKVKCDDKTSKTKFYR